MKYIRRTEYIEPPPPGSEYLGVRIRYNSDAWDPYINHEGTIIYVSGSQVRVRLDIPVNTRSEFNPIVTEVNEDLEETEHFDFI